MSIVDRIRANHTIQSLLRVLQFLSATISLGLFSSRLYKIYRLVRQTTASNGAVEGILAAAVAYTLIAMLVKFCLKGRGSSILRWLWVILDLLFVGAFIAVAILTRPNGGGSSGPCRKTRLQPVIPKGYDCNLPWGVFILAIVSTLLHAITAAFYQIRDDHRERKALRREEKKAHEMEQGRRSY